MLTGRLLAIAIAALLPGRMTAQPPVQHLQQPVRSTLPSRTFDVPIDTNSAGAYYQLGVIFLRARPADAARAFYWASRLDPALAEAAYGRGVAIALMLRDHGPEHARGGAFLVPRDDYRRVDSLRAQAYLRNPFVQITAERALLPPLVTDPVSMDPYFRGWLYLISGSPQEAVKSYAEALVRQPQAKKIHAERARAFYAMEQYDSSLAELTALLSSLRRADDTTLVHIYRSKANLEYMVGIVQAKRGDLGAARAALGRSLSEDLAFHPARSLLAYIDLLEGDTTAAIAEFENAVQLKGDDPVLRYNFGVTLLGAGDLTRAEVHLRRAIELEPYYALPRFYLARVLELQGHEKKALAAYREYYARAAREDPAAEWTAKKLNLVERRDRHQP
jgi:tetratricopeptide (TPR) repeat protein